jgi:hypothetical protein
MIPVGTGLQERSNETGRVPDICWFRHPDKGREVASIRALLGPFYVIKRCVSGTNPPVHAWSQIDRGRVYIMSSVHKGEDDDLRKRRSGAMPEEF